MMSGRYPDAARLAAGTLLAERYRLTSLLGRGGMGEVWAARHVLTGKAVAVKRLVYPSEERGFGEARARFALEAKSACAVEHPNVVEVFDFIESDAHPPFIVMELLRGETLAARLVRGPLGSAQAVAALLLPVVSAVGTAHERGIVHRDLKPSNIFLDVRPGEGRPLVKVLDFGIAKWLMGEPGDGGLRTRTGSTLGTPSYMAPEQATGDRNADHRADIWSLGVILYEALSGVRPLEGDNAAQLVMRLLSTGIMPIEQLVPELPPELAELVGRMLSRDVTRRPVDLREVYGILCTLSGEMCVAFGPPPSRGDTGASRTDAELEGVVAAAQSAGSVRIAARGHAAATQRSPQALATHTAIEVNSLPISGAPPASERGQRPRRSLYVALIGGAAALIYGGLFWLGRGDATLASPGPSAPGAGGASVEGAAGSVPASRLAAPVTDTRAARALPAGSAPVGAAGAGPFVQAAPTARPGDAGKGRSRERGRAAATEKRSAAARRVPAPRDRAQGAALPVRDAAQRAVGATPARAQAGTQARSSDAPHPPPAPPQTTASAPPGAACESSDECQSRLCAAYTCQ